MSKFCTSFPHDPERERREGTAATVRQRPARERANTRARGRK
jgi:hypothetical protein